MPLSVNHCYFTAKNGQRILKKEAKDWIAEVKSIAEREVKAQGWTPTEKQKIVAEIYTYWKDNRRRDVHNGCKLTMDALEILLYDDDRWVLPRYMDFEVDASNPRVEIKLYLKEETNV